MFEILNTPLRSLLLRLLQRVKLATNEQSCLSWEGTSYLSEKEWLLVYKIYGLNNKLVRISMTGSMFIQSFAVDLSGLKYV